MMMGVLLMRIRDAHQVEVQYYWPQVEGKKIHIGIVHPKLYNRLSFVVSICLNILNIPLMRYSHDISSLSISTLKFPVEVIVVEVLVGIWLSVLLHKSRSYYLIDQKGQPIRFYSESIPWQIKGKRRLNKKDFLKAIYVPPSDQR